MLDAAPLKLTRLNGVGTLLIDRVEKRNALNLEMLRHLPGLLAEVAEDPACKVLIVTGGAGRVFSAGADIEEFEQIYATQAATAEFTKVFATAQTAMANLPKPAIAMVAGACVGGGCALTLGCDVRFADTNARFAIPPARLGLVYSLADTSRLVRSVGISNAADLLFTGRLIDADEALRMGLVSRVAEPSALDAETRAWAQSVAANAQSSHRATKAILARIRDGAAHDDAATIELFTEAFSSTAFAEGRQASVQKRAPDFSACQ